MKYEHDPKMLEAIQAVQQGMAIREAARKFSVPRTTLHRKLRAESTTVVVSKTHHNIENSIPLNHDPTVHRRKRKIESVLNNSNEDMSTHTPPTIERGVTSQSKGTTASFIMCSIQSTSVWYV